MTANQVRALEVQESRRANLAREEETRRANEAKERETMRTNQENEAIKRRSNNIAEWHNQYMDHVALMEHMTNQQRANFQEQQGWFSVGAQLAKATQPMFSALVGWA